METKTFILALKAAENLLRAADEAAEELLTWNLDDLTVQVYERYQENEMYVALWADWHQLEEVYVATPRAAVEVINRLVREYDCSYLEPVLCPEEAEEERVLAQAQASAKRQRISLD